MSSSTGPCTADIMGDPANCGACGRACSPQGTTNLSCIMGFCNSSCVPGHVNINQPPAPFPDDGCETPVHRTFVTSITVNGGMNGMTGGAAAGDAICQQTAMAAGIAALAPWRAWLSDHNSSPLTRFVMDPGPYILLDGTLVASNFLELTSGTLQHAVDMDEMMNPTQVFKVWTGTETNGAESTIQGDNGQPISHCQNWSAAGSDSDFALLGDSSHNDSLWTSNPPAQGCYVQSIHLYCFEQ